MGTLGSRVTTFGLADLRGGLSVGFDEGAWITTSFGVGQMLIGVCSTYLGAVFGARRVLLLGIVLFFTTSLLGPLSPNLPAFLVMHFLGGVGSGTFIPLTISFILRSLPARLVVYGVAVYAMNSELSQNVAASLEGWYSDHWSWHWIDWQYCVVLPVMFVCVSFGMPRDAVNMALVRQLDWPGLAYAAIGFSLLYAGLDQGNRLDWSGNGLIVGLLLAGGCGDDGVRDARVVDAAAVREHPAAGAREPAAAAADAGGIPLHHPVHRLHHPDLSADRAELSRVAGGRCPAVDRAAAIGDRVAAWQRC